MWRFFGGFFVGLLSVAASLSTIYSSWYASVQQNAVFQVAIAVASPGSNLTDVASAKSVPEAIDAIKSLVREVPKPPKPAEQEPAALMSVLGEESDFTTNVLYKVTKADIPVIVSGIDGNTAQGKIYGRNFSINITDSVWLPEPVDYCKLTLLGTSEPADQQNIVDTGSAKFSVDCNK